MSPGDGAGNEAAADALIKAILPTMHKALGAYPVGSKKYQGVLNAIRALTSQFGQENKGALVPAAIQQIAQNAKTGGPMSAAPPPGIVPAGGPPPNPEALAAA